MGGCIPSQLRSMVSPWDNEKPNSPKMPPEERKIEQMIPHRFEEIMKEADDHSIGVSSNQIYSKVFLSKKTKLYWVEEGTMHNCFMLFARSLTFAWGEDTKRWKWCPIEETSDAEMAVLLGVYWLEIYGKFETSYLTPDVNYEVMFVVMMMEKPSLNVSTTLKLKHPDGSVQERKIMCLQKELQQQEVSPQKQPQEQQKVSLQKQSQEKWIELRVGNFMVKSDQTGEMEISLFEYGRQQKKGLMVKGAIIRPQK